MFVTAQFVAIAGGDFFLQRLDTRLFELDDVLALDTNEVIVMREIVCEFVAREPVAKTALERDTAFCEEFERSVNSGVANTRIGGAHHREQLFDAEMVGGREECLHDQATLVGRAQTLLDHVLREERTEVLEVRLGLGLFGHHAESPPVFDAPLCEASSVYPAHMRMVISALAVVATLVVENAARADGEVEVDARVDVPIAAVGGVAWIGSEIFKSDIVPARCRWCDRDGAGRDTLNGLDSGVRDAFRWNNTGAANTTSSITGFALAPLFALGGVALAAGLDHKLKESLPDALLVIESTMLAADLNQLVKFIAVRERPFVHVLAPSDKNGTSAPADNNLSFFSGHTTLVFSLAVSAGTVTSMRHRKIAPIVWATGLTIAAATGYLRIAADKHYFTDVLMGAAIGSLFGFVVPFFFHGPTKPGAIAWNLVPVPGGLGIGGVY